jgi:hypothetical protein
MAEGRSDDWSGTLPAHFADDSREFGAKRRKLSFAALSGVRNDQGTARVTSCRAIRSGRRDRLVDNRFKLLRLDDSPWEGHAQFGDGFTVGHGACRAVWR